MSTQKKSIDVYTLVTERIIEHLEKGTIPWRQPWTDAGMPTNLATGKEYRGVNVLLLASLCYQRNSFLTFRQAKELGGSVKKGEKSHPVVFWKRIEKENETTKEKEIIPLLRQYHVFNIAQCEGIPPEKLPPVIECNNDPIKSCEDIIEKMRHRPEIRHEKHQAFYDSKYDFVNVPEPKTFVNSASYYGTLFHELLHSTGHASRLNRKELVEQGRFGSELYATEELTAEIGASYLKSRAGIPIEELENNAAYIQAWLKRLKNDKKCIVYASSQAQKATDFILNIERELEQELPERTERNEIVERRERRKTKTSEKETQGISR